jgi:hypothetical protein
MRYKPTLPLVQVFLEESPNRRRPGKEPARRQEIGGASSFWSGVCDSRRVLKHEREREGKRGSQENSNSRCFQVFSLALLASAPAFSVSTSLGWIQLNPSDIGYS